MPRLAVVAVLLLAVVASAASVFSDPKLMAGAECCACLQDTAADGTALGPEAYDQNCLPGRSAEDETCSDEVASQMVDGEEDQPIRVLAEACYTRHCQAECQAARDNGLRFTVVENP